MKLQGCTVPAGAGAFVSRALLSSQPQQHFCPLAAATASQRFYATSSGSSSKRRAITPFNDDGHVPWTELSAAERTARAAQQTFNLGLVLVGLALTGGVGYFLWSDVFSPDSKTTFYNRAVDRIKKDHQCLDLLGDSKKITAYGEETYNKWRRARPIASTTRKDPQGNEHFLMHFNVEGPRGKGVANLHLVRRLGQDDFEYKYFFVDVKGHQRVYLENASAKNQNADTKNRTRLFGINWR